MILIKSILDYDLLSAITGFLIAQLVNNLPAMQGTPVQFLGQEDPWRRDRLPTLVFLGFPNGSGGTESASNAGRPGIGP